MGRLAIIWAPAAVTILTTQLAALGQFESAEISRESSGIPAIYQYPIPMLQLERNFLLQDSLISMRYASNGQTEFWRIDGEGVGFAIEVPKLFTGVLSATIVEWGNGICFIGDFDYQFRLCKLNAETGIVELFPANYTGGLSDWFMATVDHVYFLTWDYQNLWRTDGTEKGTELVWAPSPYGYIHPPISIAVASKNYVFAAREGFTFIDRFGSWEPGRLRVFGKYVNKTIGYDVAGYLLVGDQFFYHDIPSVPTIPYKGCPQEDQYYRASAESSSSLGCLDFDPNKIIPFSNTYIIKASAPDSGLYVLRGPPDIVLPLSPLNATIMGTTAKGVFFSAHNGDSGPAIWITDGFDVRHVASFGENTTTITAVAVWQDRLFFTRRMNEGSVQLWSTDGSASGLKFVSLLNTRGAAMRYVGDCGSFFLFYGASDELNGELWYSGGTGESTGQWDLNPGSPYSSVRDFHKGTNSAWFTGETPENPATIFEIRLDELYTHSGDFNRDGAINISELLRVIQLFNAEGYHCEEGTEDGYAPGGLESDVCNPHDLDFNPQNERIELSELLRAVQLFNSFGYFKCPGEESEDGYCASS